MKGQFALFADPPLTIVNDREGGIVYYPACIPADMAARCFQTLLERTPWRNLRRPMYDRVVDVPRLIANYALDDPERPPCLDALLAAVQEAVPGHYTRVGLNLYRDEHDSVAPHGDRDDDLIPGDPITIVSLGAPRAMTVRPAGGGPSRRFTLEPGSVLMMSHACQRTHDHAIPKCSTPTGPRISLAFRAGRLPAKQHDA